MKSWMDELDRARTGEEILEDARDYCALVHPRELALLPADCREIRLDAPTDIPRVMRTLSAGVARVGERSAEAGRLRDLLRFLVRAEQRLGELAARADSP